MEDQPFDRFCQDLARRCDRRSILRGIVGGLAAVFLAGNSGSRALATPESDGGLVFDYYQAIDARKFKVAYGFLGASFKSRQTLTEFAAGFGETVYDDLVVNSVRHVAALDRVDYNVSVTAWQADDSVLAFAGTYTAGRENGATKLVDANIRPVTAPDVPPLCRVTNLNAVMTGDAGAGQRYGTISVTNVSNGPCVLGGVPRVTLHDGTGATIIAAKNEPGVPITTVVLAPDQRAVLELHWSNWCGGEIAGQPRATLQFFGRRGSLRGLRGVGIPPCLTDPHGKSSLTVNLGGPRSPVPRSRGAGHGERLTVSAASPSIAFLIEASPV